MSKKLYRNLNGKIIAGVSTGLAEYFDIDPVIIRALFIITTIAYGIGVIAYIVLWIIVPAKKIEEVDFDNNLDDTFNMESENFNYKENDSKNDRKLIGGVILIIIGVLLFLNQIIPGFDIEYIIPIVLIIIGILILSKQINKRT
jgi:phage shock protein PspC (stress-responsive transcriptional regulator)